MSYPVDGVLFEQLSKLAPEEVCRKTGSGWNQEIKSYELDFWGDDFIIDLDRKKIFYIDGGTLTGHGYLPIFLINYLMQAGGTELCGEFISEKDLPGGVTFFRGPHVIPTDMIASRFENGIELFCRRCETLGGKSLEMADRAYTFTLAPRISIAVLYWQGDDEFPAESRVLFDRESVSGLALDTVYALAVEVCCRIADE